MATPPDRTGQNEGGSSSDIVGGYNPDQVTRWYCDEEDTLWKANTEPKDGGLEDDFPFRKG